MKYILLIYKVRKIVKIRIPGRRLTFTLNYSQHFQKDLAFKIQSILLYEENGYKIILIPRSDVQGRQFEVQCTDDEIITKINRGGARANSNNGLVVAWETTKLVDMQWTDPDDIYVTWNNFAVI